MALTRDFKASVKARAERDPEFRIALLQEAVEALLQGDTETGRTLLRDYVNAPVGFVQLAQSLGETTLRQSEGVRTGTRPPLLGSGWR